MSIYKSSMVKFFQYCSIRINLRTHIHIRQLTYLRTYLYTPDHTMIYARTCISHSDSDSMSDHQTQPRAPNPSGTPSLPSVSRSVSCNSALQLKPHHRLDLHIYHHYRLISPLCLLAPIHLLLPPYTLRFPSHTLRSTLFTLHPLPSSNYPLLFPIYPSTSNLLPCSPDLTSTLRLHGELFLFAITETRSNPPNNNTICAAVQENPWKYASSARF